MGGAKTSDDFSISGPKHLAVIDWNDLEHRTAVAASVVYEVYTMQRDKAKGREPLANPLWEYFGFSLEEHLINEADGSIYGAVFKFDYENTPHSGVPPRYVIAFRGRMLSLETWFSDMKHDLRCFANNLDRSKRFEHAIKAIKTVLAKPTTSETTTVWLAGHSLGAAIALLAGKDMASLGSRLETYAFEPPSSLALETKPGSHVFKHGFTSGKRSKMGGEEKTSDDFSISGPKHLTSIDWNDSYHRTAVAASLVQGVYTMQRDKAKKREPLANPWWEFFRFSLDEHLINKADGSIYGAVFKYDNENTPHSGIPPRYVIAFRGTMISSKTVFSDLKEDLRCIFTNLSCGKRFRHAKKAIKTVLDKTPTGETTSVWLAGHSLGAAIALLAGKAMAKKRSLLETYAFNPPRPSLPIETIIPGSNALKFGVRLIKSLTEATLAGLPMFIALQIEGDQTTPAWTPYLYVHPADLICTGYIGHFKHKSFMSDIGLSNIDRAADRFSLRRTLCLGGEGIQLLSSVDMTVNSNNSTDSKTAHGLEQWFKSSKTAHGLEQWWETDPALVANWKIQRIRPAST